jgi:hypothetical protein
LKNSDIPMDFSTLCQLFYVMFKASENWYPVENLFNHIKNISVQQKTVSNIDLDMIFLKDELHPLPSQKVTLEALIIILNKLIKENLWTVHLKNMYDIS